MIDAIRFARAGESCSGEVPIADRDRLLDLLADDQGTINFLVRGELAGGRPTLHLTIEAVVKLVCQRCLEPYDQSVKIDSRLPIARNEAELERWERDDPLLDALLADQALDVLALVEDEILLGLPVAPRHPEGECGWFVGKADGRVEGLADN